MVKKNFEEEENLYWSILFIEVLVFRVLEFTRYRIDDKKGCCQARAPDHGPLEPIFGNNAKARDHFCLERFCQKVRVSTGRKSRTKVDRETLVHPPK